MKIAVCIGIAAFMLADAFTMWCLCRVGGLADRRAEIGAASKGKKRKEKRDVPINNIKNLWKK